MSVSPLPEQSRLFLLEQLVDKRQKGTTIMLTAIAAAVFPCVILTLSP